MTKIAKNVLYIRKKYKGKYSIGKGTILHWNTRGGCIDRNAYFIVEDVTDETITGSFVELDTNWGYAKPTVTPIKGLEHITTTLREAPIYVNKYTIISFGTSSKPEFFNVNGVRVSGMTVWDGYSHYEGDNS